MESRGRGGNWVSKTDLIRYVRCPYSWWLLDRGEITFEDTVDEFQLRLLLEGTEFQGLVESSAELIEVAPEDLEPLMASQVKILATPMFENRRLKIFGQPDGIDAAGGALFPIEIKSHKDVQRTDEIELAFYWLLLQPYRTKRVRQPRGLLILRRDGVAEEVEVPIREHRFEEVRRLLVEIRGSRRNGVRPRICGCNVCSRGRREEVLSATTQRKDLTLIYGIGWNYGPALERMGINTWEDLMSCDPSRVVTAMKQQRYFLSGAQVEQWKCHARSYAMGTPVVFGNGSSLPQSFIALDLEYTTHVWLIGICIAGGGRRDYHVLWADGARAVKTNLGRLAAILADNSALPILTWSGEGADLPQLRQAAERLNVPDLALAVQERHLDLFQYVWRNLRLPIPGLSLKEVGAYFGIPRLSSVYDGLEAQLMYGRYRRTRGKAKILLRQQLIDYNRDDLDALVEVAGRVRDLVSAPRAVQQRRTT